MEFRKKCAQMLRLIFGWLMILDGGISGVSVGIGTLLTLFGVLETDSFGERLTSFIAGAAATVGFFMIFWLGIRLKNSGSRNMAPALVMQKSSSADQKETQEAANGKVRRKAVSYLLDKKEKQEDTAEQCQQCEEEAVFVLYEGHWAGKAENGEDKIFLKIFEDECVITYESLIRNCYATPPKEDVRSDVRRRSLSTISTWSLEDLLLFINRVFHLSISICDCCSEEQYRAWIEQQNTEFYSMEIMVDGTKQECMVRRVNEKSCEEVRFQGQTYFWKQIKGIHGLYNYDYAVEVRLNEKIYYLYHTQIPNKNDTLYWVVSQITESTFELLKHPPCDHEKIVLGRKIGKIGGYEAERRSTIYKVLALATGRTIGYYQADGGTRNICLEKAPETVVPNDNHSCRAVQSFRTES